MKTVTQSPNWRYKITIKNSFEDEVTPQLVVSLSQKICKQLEIVKKRVDADRLVREDHRIDLSDKLTELIDNFKFASDFADGTIKEDEWDNYSFDGDFEDLMNDYLTELYDVADERILLNSNVLEKFMWID